MEDPYRRPERASTGLGLLLLFVFLKDAAHRGQREYWFVVWADEESGEDWIDLNVSPALLEAMKKGRPEPEGSGFVSAGVEESSTPMEIGRLGSSGTNLHVEAVPDRAAGSRTIAPPHCAVERLPGDVSEAIVAHATVKALRTAVDGVEAGRRQEAAAAAWQAEPVVRFLCSTFGDGIADVSVSDEQFIVITAVLAGDVPVEATIAIVSDGTCAGKISAGDTHLARTAPDAPSFERVLPERIAGVGVHRGNSGGGS